MIDLLLILLLALHLVCMNVAGAGPLVCIPLDSRRLTRESPRYRAGKKLASLSLWALVVGSVLGLLAGWLLWLGDHQRFFTVLGMLNSRVHFGIVELLFTLVCYVAYLAWWRRGPRRGWGQQVLHHGLAFLGATNLLYHFPSFFAVVAKLAAGGADAMAPDEAAATLSHAQYLQAMFAPDVLARWTHFTLASAAAAGVLLLWLALSLSSEPEESPQSAQRMAAWGARLALLATLLQILVGTWVLLSLPRLDQGRLLGGSLAASGALLAGIVTSVGLLHHLAAAAWGEPDRKTAQRVAGLFSLTVLLMTAALHYSRGDSLRASPETAATARHVVELAELP